MVKYMSKGEGIMQIDMLYCVQVRGQPREEELQDEEELLMTGAFS